MIGLVLVTIAPERNVNQIIGERECGTLDLLITVEDFAAKTCIDHGISKRRAVAEAQLPELMDRNAVALLTRSGNAPESATTGVYDRRPDHPAFPPVIAVARFPTIS